MEKPKKRVCPRWTQEEIDFVIDSVKKFGRRKGLKIAAFRLKRRTYDACSWQYHVHCKNNNILKESAKITNQTLQKSKPFNNIVKIQYHNGTTVDANIIVKRKDLVVAQHKDMVVTIDLR